MHMRAPAFFPCSGLRKPSAQKSALCLLSLLAFVIFGTFPGQAQAQGPATHTYMARLIRSVGVNPMKPVLADVLQKFPEAEVTLEREDDVLHITTDQELSSAGLRLILDPYGVELASFLKDGVPVDGPAVNGKMLPWLSGLEEGAELSPEDIAGRKNAWVNVHPEEYQRWLNAAGPTPERQ